MEKFTLLPVLPKDGGTATHLAVTVPLENSRCPHAQFCQHMSNLAGYSNLLIGSRPASLQRMPIVSSVMGHVPG